MMLYVICLNVILYRRRIYIDMLTTWSQSHPDQAQNYPTTEAQVCIYLCYRYVCDCIT